MTAKHARYFGWSRRTAVRHLAPACAALLCAGAAAGLAVAQTPGSPSAGQGTGSQTAGSQTAGSPSAPPSADACAGRTDVLGVSRVVEVNTEGGQLFGQQQYKDNDFLADGEVVLTFDDGPLRPYTVPVLQALDAHCTKATFFVVGRMAVADPEMVRETARRGHTIGTHTWSHRNQRTLNATLAKGEVELAISTVRKTAGQPTAPFFRFPYLADSRSMTAHLRSRDHGIFSIDVDSRDFRTKSPAEVQRVIVGQLMQRRKGILLFHDIQPSTAGALKSLLGELKARGFKVVHMISKTPATTLPEYDALADHELQRKQLAAARSPLANRAIVWPVAIGPAPENAKPARAAPPPVAATAPTAARVPAAALAPPAPSVAPPAAAPPAAAAEAPPSVAPPRQRWRSDDDDSWQDRVFRN
jgi:peptidoglycan/xylan/chitin deacetylase (PgdA/CDA1 family)